MANVAKDTVGKAKAGGLGVGKFVAGLIVLGLIAAGVLLFLGNTPPPVLQQFASTNATVPEAYSSALSQSSTSMGGLSYVVTSHLNTTNQFSVNYTGEVWGKADSGVASALGAVESSVAVWEAQYGTNRKLSATVNGASIAGTLNMQYASLQNGTYVCTNFNPTAVQQGSVTALTVSKKPVCTPGDSLFGINLQSLYYLNFTQFAGQGMHFRYNQSYESTYGTNPCTVVQGTISGDGGSGYYVFCMSNTYYVPLYMGYNFTNSQGSFTLILKESSIGNSSSQGTVVSLPYPVG